MQMLIHCKYSQNMWTKLKVICIYTVVLLICIQQTEALEWSINDQYDPTNRKLHGLLYPHKKCTKKKQVFKSDQTNAVEQSKHWSVLFSQYWFPLGDFDIRNRNPDLYTKDEHKPMSFLETYAVAIWLLFMIVFYGIAVFLVPLIGFVIFRFFWFLGFLCANSKTRVVCRWIVIHFQKFKRNNEFYLTPDGRKPTQNRFRMPKMFREDSDEDVPPTLKEPPSSDFSEANSEDEHVSSAEDLLMHAAYGIQVVRRPKWRPPQQIRKELLEKKEKPKKMNDSKRRTLIFDDCEDFGLEADDENDESENVKNNNTNNNNNNKKTDKKKTTNNKDKKTK